MKREDRRNTLNANNINTGNFFAFDVPEGATIVVVTPDGKQVKYTRDGKPVEDELKKVRDIGYIREDPGFRRFVMAQTFRILYSGLSVERYILERRGYFYQYEQTLEELEAICKLPLGSKAREMRVRFFDKFVVHSLCRSFINDLRGYIGHLPVRYPECRGYVECKAIPRHGYVPVKDIEGLIFHRLEEATELIRKSVSYEDLHFLYGKFFKDANETPFWKRLKNVSLWSTAPRLHLNSDWVSAYKGAGAYYTLQNLIKFHDCRVFEDGRFLSLEESLAELERKTDSLVYTRDWYKLYGMMKEVIAANDFDFRKAMEERYQ